MKAKNCLIFGGSGQIGRHLIRKLTKNNYKVTVVTRNIHQKSYLIKTQANAGYIDIIEANIFDQEKIVNLFKKADICINLVGILFEKKEVDTFKNIHSVFPLLLAKLSKTNIVKNFPLATILRPSIVYSVDDNFTTNFMTMLKRLPFFPLYYDGKTKFMPIHCSDLADTIYKIISENIYSKIIECVGPEVMTFREILEKLLKLIDKKRILIPLPLSIANFSAKIFEKLPNPLLTSDQLRLLKYDNIISGKYKTNGEIGVPSLKRFDDEVKKYAHMWRDGGQFSTEKYVGKEKIKTDNI